MAWIRACGGASATKKYIIKNGVSNIGDFLGYNSVATNLSSGNQYEKLITKKITKPTDDNKYLSLSINKTYGGPDGSYYTFAGTIASGSMFDITNYKKLVIEVDAVKNNTNLEIGITQDKPSANYKMPNYKVINATTTVGNFVIEFDISALSGYYYLALLAHNYMPYNNTFTSTINIKNAYMV